MTPEIEERLRRRVDAILDAGVVPAPLRPDVGEELRAHLADRWQAYVDAGVDPDRAADEAIADLGPVDRLGREFRRALRSRLWASTIGVVLPLARPEPRRPRVVTWLIAVLWFVALFEVVVLATVAGLSPLRLAIGVAGVMLNAVLVVAAIRALDRGARWAAWFAVGQTTLLFVSGLDQMATAGNPTLSISGAAAAIVLLRVVGDQGVLASWTRPVVGLGRRGLAALAILAVATEVAPLAAPILPDPTQAGPSDVAVAVSTACDSGTQEWPLNPGATETIVTADVTWQRLDLLPRGLAATAPGSLLDLAGVGTGPTGYAGLMEFTGTLLESRAVDRTSDALLSSGGWAEDEYTMRMIPDGTLPWRISLTGDQLRPGHTYRLTWRIVFDADPGSSADEVVLRYAHLDRFALDARLPRCGGRALAEPATDLAIPGIG